MGIYTHYGTAYETQLISFARSAVRNTAVDFSVNQFLTNRSIIRDQMAQNVSLSLSELFVDCPAYTVQLNEIEFQDTVLQKQLQAAITLEENLLKGFVQEATEIRAETDKLVEEYDSNTTVILRTAEASKLAQIETAQAQYDEIVDSARGNGMAAAMTALGIEAEEDKSRFLSLMAILDNSEARTVDLDSSAIVNLNA